MKIILCYLCNYHDRNDYYISLLPYGLASIASYLEQMGIETVLANFSDAGWKGAVKAILDEKPDMLAVSIFSYNRTESERLICEIKKRMHGLTVVAGGPHPTYLAKEYAERFPEIDHIVAGEGELALYKIVDDIRSGRKPERIIVSGRIEDLDSIRPASYFTGRTIGINHNEQFKYIISSRGCPHKCTFCCSPDFWKRKVHYRSPENLFREVEHLYRKFGIIYFSIRDDNFTLKKDRVMSFCKMLRESGMYLMWNCQSRVDTVDEDMLVEMKLAGLEHIQYGVESGSERILKMYDKSITIPDIEAACRLTRNAGLYLSLYLMVGMPGETYSDIQKTKALMRRVLPGDAVVSPVAYYPGTDLYEKLKSAGGIDDRIWFDSAESGIFARNDVEVKKWINELLAFAGGLREISWYKEKDFSLYRKNIRSDCWVTDILEGDYYMDGEEYDEAGLLYGRVASNYPDNAWGFMRLGKLDFYMDEYESAALNFKRVTEIVPAYYGGWLKLAEARLASGNKKGARQSIETAYRLNSYDKRIINLKRLI